jgi:hypothetical protein
LAACENADAVDGEAAPNADLPKDDWPNALWPKAEAGELAAPNADGFAVVADWPNADGAPKVGVVEVEPNPPNAGLACGVVDAGCAPKPAKPEGLAAGVVEADAPKALGLSPAGVDGVPKPAKPPVLAAPAPNADWPKPVEPNAESPWELDWPNAEPPNAG